MSKPDELNGFWQWLFKARQVAGLALVPIVIAFMTVIVVPWCRGIEARIVDIQDEGNNYDKRILKLEGFAGEGERFTKSQADKMKAELQNEWLKEIGEIRRQIDMLPQTIQIPPQWWEKYVREEFIRVNQRLDAHEKEKTP